MEQLEKDCAKLDNNKDNDYQVDIEQLESDCAKLENNNTGLANNRLPRVLDQTQNKQPVFQSDVKTIAPRQKLKKQLPENKIRPILSNYQAKFDPDQSKGLNILEYACKIKGLAKKQQITQQMTYLTNCNQNTNAKPSFQDQLKNLF